MELKELIKTNCDFIFDTSALCALYTLLKEGQNSMSLILNHFKSRIWIPDQVIQEYVKNRKKAVCNPIKDCYQIPKKISQSTLPDELDNFIKKLKEKDFHPYIDEKQKTHLIDIKSQISDLLSEFNNIARKEFTKQTDTIEGILNDDVLEKTISELPHGIPLTWKEIMHIISEGDLRYRNEIPPGYMDSKTKSGIRKYGDLIIWKEMLNHASKTEHDVIFVCNDVKEDWYEPSKNGTIPKSPRKELIKEFKDTVGKEIIICTLSQFLVGLEQACKDPEMLSLFSGLEAIKDTIKHKELEQFLSKRNKNVILCCDNCNQEFSLSFSDIDFYWEHGATNDRSMGPEREYVCTHEMECPFCSEPINIQFSICEYPEGAYNNSETQCEGASILSVDDFTDFLDFYDDYEYCERCGERIPGGQGLCETCQAEYENFMSRDD